MNGVVEQNIIRFIDRHNLVENGDKLLIAFSGGADSLFALLFFHKFKAKYGIELSAMHVNHMLRGREADEDELFCKSVCENLGVQFNSIKVDVKKFAKERKHSIEEAARILRYQKLNEFSEQHGVTKIVTAHNLNDNTETVLLNLFRGTGLSGVSGIPVQRGIIIRPLLSVNKEDIINYLNENNIQFRMDSTNLQNDYSRNFLRNEIIPKIKEKINPAIDLNILKFSEIAKESNKIIHNLAEDIAENHIKKTEFGLKIYDSVVEENAIENFNIAIRIFVEKEFNSNLSFSDISQIKSLFNRQVGGRIDLSEKLSAVRERNYVLLYPKTEVKKKDETYFLNLNEEISIGNKTISAEVVEKNEVIINADNSVEYIDGDKISFPLVIRKWQDGDKFNPLGLNGTKKISDFLTELKVNASEKKNQHVLLSNNKIIWVINYRIDESVKISNNSKRIIKLWVK